ncbi:hypothetical protein SAY87_012817 [Trapa incisa]|uniref:Uncharacterized protein n=1 Tax=Trapa incisa TaxID=236973 RepID=A0AAN7GR37_9MYRT|nr:hypothetical protein SAY87_012817 [Trapa incisa]
MTNCFMSSKKMWILSHHLEELVSRIRFLAVSSWCGHMSLLPNFCWVNSRSSTLSSASGKDRHVLMSYLTGSLFAMPIKRMMTICFSSLSILLAMSSRDTEAV